MTLRHALRSLKRTPVFTITVLLTLVLGIGSVGSMFAIVYGVLLAPLPYGEPDRLVSVALQAGSGNRILQPPAVYFTYRQFAQRLDNIGFYRTGSTNVWTEGDGAQSVVATWVTASMLPLLQVPPLLGRGFSAEEEVRGGPNAVILSESEWRARFNAASDVIGKTLIVNSAARQIVGVMPARFSFPSSDTRLWLPVKHTDSAKLEDFSYSSVARLAAGATAEQARSELAVVLPRMAELFPGVQSGGSTSTWLSETRPTPVVLPLREAFTSEIARTLWMLAAAAGLVLLVAWANVANLMLVRADARQLELSVRAALGADRWRIASHFLGESLLLGAASGALALLVSYGAVRALVAFGPADIPRLAELSIGWAAIGFIALITLLSVLICAAVPALRVRRGQTTGKSQQRLRASITIVQLAFALVVSLGSALLLRTAHNLYQVQPGFDANEVTTLQILLPYARYGDATTVAFYHRLTELVRQVPIVRDAGLTGKLPLGAGWTSQHNYQVEGADGTQPLSLNVVDGGYFATMRIPLRAGRTFARLDQPQNGEIMISQRASESLFGDANGIAAVGKRLTLAPNGPTYTIVGVVGDVRHEDLAAEPSAMIYRPQVVPSYPNVEPGPRASMLLVVRSSGAPGAVLPAIRQIVRELDPSVPIFNVETMQDVVRASTSRLSLARTLMTTAALITLMLSAIGLYGVMETMVSLRTREFGVRIALGANPRRIAGWVALRGLVLTASGIAVGLVLFALAAPLLGSFLYGVSTSDPPTLVGVTLLLLGTATLASWIPARRAAQVDPAQALRAQ